MEKKECIHAEHHLPTGNLRGYSRVMSRYCGKPVCFTCIKDEPAEPTLSYHMKQCSTCGIAWFGRSVYELLLSGKRPIAHTDDEEEEEEEEDEEVYSEDSGAKSTDV